MINPEVYNDEALMRDWYNYRTHNAVSPELYQTMVDFDKEMIGIEDGVKEMVRSNWCRIMDENMKVAMVKEKGRVAGEKVSHALITGTKTVVKWVKRAMVIGALVIVGVAVFNHWYDGYKELQHDSIVYPVERFDKSYEYVIVEVPVEVPVPGHKPSR